MASTSLCLAGCGFFGSAVTGGYCSKCFRERAKTQQAAGALGTASTATVSSSPSPTTTPLPMLSTPTSSSSTPAVSSSTLVAPVSPPEAMQIDVQSPSSHLSSPVPLPGSFGPMAIPNTLSPESLNTIGGVSVSPGGTTGGLNAGVSPAQTSSSLQTDTTRCWKCNSKVGLLGFKCKCRLVFCSKHRLAGQHDCTFDYKAAAREDLITRMPTVAADKVVRF